MKFYRVSKKLQTRKLSQLGVPISSTTFDGFGIVVSTFEDRFFTYALPLIQSLRLATLSPITLIINGNLSKERNEEAYSRFLSEISHVSNVYPVTFQGFQGCARMWNTGINFSEAENLLILNDDISVVPDTLRDEINVALAVLQQHKILTINFSWSHFFISRQAIRELGWFDERLLGIGNEDGDYDDRHLAKFGRKVENLNLMSFVNISDETRDKSVASTKSKYSLFNEILHQEKMSLSKSVPQIALYPLWAWSENFRKYLSVSDPEIVRKAIKQGINEL